MEQEFMARAIEISRRSLEEPGAAPYGAVVVKNGRIVGEGLNRSTSFLDPSSHGEIEAMREACRRLGTTDLSDCDLYTSCSPCAMCTATMHIAGIRRVYYGASFDQSGRVLAPVGPGVMPEVLKDNVFLRTQVGLPIEERRMPSAQLMDADAVAVLEAWAAKQTHRDRA